jgi:hypothetical protein
MTERSRFWDGSTIGDAVSITDNEFMDRFFRAILNGTGNQGVLDGWLNELAVTDGGGLDAAVASGGAIVYGMFYESDAAETVTLPNNSTVYVIVSRDWAAATTRLTHDGGAGLTQNAGVRYDIPLAEVTTAGGAITVITDARDYCEFTTSPPLLSVISDNIQADVVTTAKLSNNTRRISRGAGELKADGTTPATWTNNFILYPSVYTGPYRDFWAFADGATNAVWLTFRVPEDIASATMTMYLWLSFMTTYGANLDQRWEWNAYRAQPSAVLSNQTGNTTFTEIVDWDQSYTAPQTLGDLTVTAGDIIHLQISRAGAHGDDTSTKYGILYAVELSYTADG